MRLLNVHSYKFESYDDLETTPPYVILSHRWGSEEVLFEDFQERPYEKEIQDLQRKLEDMSQCVESLSRQLRTGGSILDGEVRSGVSSQPDGSSVLEHKPKNEISDESTAKLAHAHLNRVKKKTDGWNKINGCCNEAKSLGFSYVWIDTCCINKDSLVEVSESINSMYLWYERAHICIAYLNDVSTRNAAAEFEKSQWFRRGWTLQELIVPDDVRFYSKDWVFLGMRSVLASKIAQKTSIEKKILYERGRDFMREFSVAVRLSWAADRTTTKLEDRAYSLIGLFGINMPVLYGEGEVASFHRLQAEIYKAVPDQSIFAWNFPLQQLATTPGDRRHSTNLFASRVDYFQGVGSIISGHDHVSNMYLDKVLASRYIKFSNGTRVMLLISPYGDGFIAYLGCRMRESTWILAIRVCQTEPGNFERMTRQIVRVDTDRFSKLKVSMVEAFISPPVQKLDSLPSGDFDKNTLLLLNDRQLLESGFAKITQTSGLSSCEEILAEVPDSTAKETFALYIRNIDLAPSTTTSEATVWSIFGDGRTSNYDIVYLNKSTGTLFIINPRLEFFDLLIGDCTVDSTIKSIVVRILQPTEEVDTWELARSVLYNRVVDEKWRVSIHVDNSSRSEKELVLKAFPIGYLELKQGS